MPPRLSQPDRRPTTPHGTGPHLAELTGRIGVATLGRRCPPRSRRVRTSPPPAPARVPAAGAGTCPPSRRSCASVHARATTHPPETPRPTALPRPVTPPEPRPEPTAPRLDPAALPMPSLSRRRVVTAAGVLVASLLAISFLKQVGEATAATDRAADLRAANAALQTDVLQLQQDLTHVQDPRFIELAGRAFGLGGSGRDPVRARRRSPGAAGRRARVGGGPARRRAARQKPAGRLARRAVRERLARLRRAGP